MDNDPMWFSNSRRWKSNHWLNILTYESLFKYISYSFFLNISFLNSIFYSDSVHILKYNIILKSYIKL